MSTSITNTEEALQSINDKSELATLLNELQSKLSELKSHLAPLAQKIADGEIKTSKGISFLQIKYQSMIQYILQLAFYTHLKLSGKQVKGHPVVESLVELRVVLEKMKPVESKLKYQIDKLVRKSVLGSQATTKPNTSIASVAASDPLSFKPNPMNLLSKGDEEEDDEMGDDTKDRSGAYRPPKLAPVSYKEDHNSKKSKRERDQLRLKEKASRSRLMKDLMAEMTDAPEEVDSMGGVNEGLGYGDQVDSAMARKDKFEEDNFVRLMVTRKEKQQLKARNRMRFETEFDHLDDFSSLAGMKEVEEEENARFRNVLTRKNPREDVDLDFSKGKRGHESSSEGFHGLLSGEKTGPNKFKKARRQSSYKGKKKTSK